ncbi:MAG TPA: tetratricopeptide repeat protein [Burkholderiales bacterium]|nr:tetratricopeptide repeat protein [Burkholderiales bacterium]
MKLRSLVFAVLLSLSCTAWAVEQEETFTDLIPGRDMLDPANLAQLLRQGDVRAMNNVGLLWAKGYNGKQSYAEAFNWWKEAAMRGYPVAMNNIGLLYAKGNGVEQDYKKAFEWWHQAAFLGNAWAMNNVGDLYEKGLGVEQSLIMALTWYLSGAQQGDRMAMYNLGLLYEAGKGVDQDYAAALNWFRKAADKGDGSSMHRIGAMYAEGRGVIADPVEAHAWYSVADLRFPPEDADEAKQNRRDLDELGTRLDAEQLARAKERAAAIDALTRPAAPEPMKPLGPGRKST